MRVSGTVAKVSWVAGTTTTTTATTTRTGTTGVGSRKWPPRSRSSRPGNSHGRCRRRRGRGGSGDSSCRTTVCTFTYSLFLSRSAHPSRSRPPRPLDPGTQSDRGVVDGQVNRIPSHGNPQRQPSASTRLGPDHPTVGGCSRPDSGSTHVAPQRERPPRTPEQWTRTRGCPWSPSYPPPCSRRKRGLGGRVRTTRRGVLGEETSRAPRRGQGSPSRQHREKGGPSESRHGEWDEGERGREGGEGRLGPGPLTPRENKDYSQSTPPTRR